MVTSNYGYTLSCLPTEGVSVGRRNRHGELDWIRLMIQCAVAPQSVFSCFCFVVLCYAQAHGCMLNNPTLRDIKQYRAHPVHPAPACFLPPVPPLVGLSLDLCPCKPDTVSRKYSLAGCRAPGRQSRRPGTWLDQNRGLPREICKLWI